MAKVSFNEGPAVAASVPEDQAPTLAPTAVVKAAPLDLAPADSGYGVSGEIDRSDLNMPRLALVQGVGPLSELFKPGQIVLNKETVLTDGDTPINLSVLHIHKGFIENLKYDPDGPRPRYLNTLAEVRAEGGTVEWMEDEPPTWVRMASTLVLIEGSADDAAFPFEFQGKGYAAAMWTLRNAAYTRAAKNIFTITRSGLRNQPLCLGRWSLASKREKIKSNFVFVPVLKMVGKQTPEFVAWVKEMGLTDGAATAPMVE